VGQRAAPAQLAEQFRDHLLVARIDVNQYTDLVHGLGIRRVPAVTLILNGQPVKRWYGDNHINEFIEAINKFKLTERTL
jgi:thioredoxin-like negative regulator of GroEL